MNNKNLLLICLIKSASLFSNAVTYELNGRLGDSLLAFSHALWISYKTKIPLIYRPFKNSDQLKLSGLHECYDDISQKKMEYTRLKLRGDGVSDIQTQGNRLYYVPWFPPHYCTVDWSDSGFIDLLRKEIAPKGEVLFLNLPTDRHHVAIHIRTGAGYDKILQKRSASTIKYADVLYPYKFPPNSFFIEQLQRVSELLNNQPIYAHIFTDSPDPEYFMNLFEEKVNKSNITYGCRTSANHHDSNVLEDFLNLSRFKYFIRPNSFFSYMATRLAEWKIDIWPGKCKWENNDVNVLTVETRVKSSNGKVRKK